MTTHTHRRLPVMWRAGLIAIVAVIIAIIVVVSAVTPARATTRTESTTPATVEVFWLVPGHGTAENVTWPQTYLANGEAGLMPAECAQVDTYLVAEAPGFYADGLLALGEDYQNDKQRGAISWRFVCAPDAIQPADEVTPGSSNTVDCATGVVTVKHWHDTITYTGDKFGYSAGSPVRTDDPDTTLETTPEQCPPIVVDPPVVPVVDVQTPGISSTALLAHTGVQEDMARAAGLTGFAALMFGFGMFALAGWQRSRRERLAAASAPKRFAPLTPPGADPDAWSSTSRKDR